MMLSKGVIQCELAQVLLKLHESYCGSSFGPPFPCPRVLRLLQDSLENVQGNVGAIELVNGTMGEVNEAINKACAYCGKDGNVVKLKRCDHCEAACLL